MMNATGRKLLIEVRCLKRDRDEWRRLAIDAVNAVQVSVELIDNIQTELNNVLAELEG